MIDAIQHNAELVRSVARDKLDADVGYDHAGVVWLDGYVTGQYERGEASNVDGLVHTLGSFLGACIVHTHGGAWVEDEHGWGIRFESGAAAYPFAKVRKHLQNGPEDSVLSFFEILPLILRGDLS